MKDKRLHLAFDLASAPPLVKTRAEKHRDNLYRVEKAEAQAKMWAQELTEARKSFNESGVELDQALETWEPKDNSVKVEKK